MMTNLDITLPQFHLLLDHYLISKDLKNKFTVEGKNVIYKAITEDLDSNMIWTIEEIVNEYSELSLVEFANKYDVEADEDAVDNYLCQESSYALGFTEDTVVFQDVLR